MREKTVLRHIIWLLSHIAHKTALDKAIFVADNILTQLYVWAERHFGGCGASGCVGSARSGLSVQHADTHRQSRMDRRGQCSHVRHSRELDCGRQSVPRNARDQRARLRILLECVSKRKIRKFEWILCQFKEETRRLSSAKSRVDDAEMAQKPPKLRIREFLRHALSRPQD